MDSNLAIQAVCNAVVASVAIICCASVVTTFTRAVFGIEEKPSQDITEEVIY